MKRVILESPFGSRVDGSRATAAEVAENIAYLKRCLRDSLRRGEAPFASHGLYPLVLDDATAEERRQGMEAGFAWGQRADEVVVYIDHGITPGMVEGIKRAHGLGLEVFYRQIGVQMALPMEEA